jgi:hypothetical protein
MDARANQQAVDQELPTKPSHFDRSDGADFALGLAERTFVGLVGINENANGESRGMG